MGLFARQIEDGNIFRRHLNISNTDDSVICKVSEIADSGIKIQSSTGQIGTGVVGLGLDFTLLDNRWASKSSPITKAQVEAVLTGLISSHTHNYLATSLKGSVNGLAELDANGYVKNTQLPSYVDDVLEYANFAALPATGESGKIYITTDNNKTFRWSGTAYAEISASLALGETSATAYRGDRGKTAYDYSQIGHLPLIGGTLSGDLQFSGTGDYLVAGNHYAFRATIDENYGLYFDLDNVRYTFRGNSGVENIHLSPDTGVIAATGGTSTNWNAAYSWGNHASAGYLTSLGTALVDADFGSNGIMVRTNSGVYGIITDSHSNWDTAYAHSQVTHQVILNGTGFVKVSGTSISYDNNTYSLSSHTHSYEPVITAGTTAQYWRGDKSWQTLDKSAVGLGSVENTALSTWAGTANIATLGTITSGVWHGTAIADSYITSASTWNAKQAALSGTGIVKSVAGTISYLTDNSANWTTAYGWGNHALAGYITSLGTALVDADFTSNGIMVRTSAGVYSIITDSHSNWDTAYTNNHTHTNKAYIRFYSRGLYNCFKK